jgi:uncharacterized protein YjcR
MHGGNSRGAPAGNQNAHRHGFYSAESTELRRAARQLLKETCDLLEKVD